MSYTHVLLWSAKGFAALSAAFLMSTAMVAAASQDEEPAPPPPPVWERVTQYPHEGPVCSLGDWETLPRPQGASGSLVDVEHAFGRYFAGNGTGHVLTSADGASWEVIETEFNLSGGWGRSLAHVASGNGIIVVAGRNGNIITSTDGENWELHAQPNLRARDLSSRPNVTGIVFDGARFVASLSQTDNGPAVMTSEDGKTWEHSTSMRRSKRGIALAQGRHMLVGGTARSLDSVHFSDDLEVWASADTSHNLGAVATDGHRFVAGGDSSMIVLSEDGGYTWEEFTAPLRAPGHRVVFNSFAYGEGLFLASGTYHDGRGRQHGIPRFDS